MAEARMRVSWLAAALLLAAPPAAAQTISAGMTTAQVRSALGDPVTVRTAGEWSYLYYLNGCAVRCGSDDVVFVQNGRVVTAVFRTGRRRFAGPGPVAALERTSDESGVIHLDERRESPAPPVRMRSIRGEPRTEGAREEPGRTIIGRPGAGPPARVGSVRVDSAQGAPATAVDDARRARENRVQENTIPRRTP